MMQRSRSPAICRIFLAHALVHVAAGGPRQKILKSLMAGSFRDMTRVASSDPEQWVQIFQANLKNLRHGVRLFQKELRRLDRELSVRRCAPRFKNRISTACRFSMAV